MGCEERAGNCLSGEPGFITSRRTYTTTTTTQTDSTGTPTTTTTTHYQVTWQRTDGSRQTHEVSAKFYDKAREGQPATLRLWRNEIVGVEVTDATEWFLPRSGSTLGYWLFAAFLGLGILLWGLLFGWWDGWFILAYRTFVWMFMGIAPVGMTTYALAYGLPTGLGLVIGIAVSAVCLGIAGRALIASLDDG